MRATKPDYPPDLRDEGLVLYALKRYEEAAQALTTYLEVRIRREKHILSY